MSNYEWNSEFSVGHPVLDQHHKNLINLFNDAYEILTQIRPSTEIKKILSELTTYSIFHFNEEEKLMKAVSFYDLENHVLEHKDFIAKVGDFKENLSNKTENLNEEIFLFLYEWLITHIKQKDQMYIEALKAK